METDKSCANTKKKLRNKFNLRHLRISLKYRPEILKLLMVMRNTNRKKTAMLKKIKNDLEILKQLYAEVSNKVNDNEPKIPTEPEISGNSDTQRALEIDLNLSKHALKSSFAQTKIYVQTSSTQTDFHYNPAINIDLDLSKHALKSISTQTKIYVKTTSTQTDFNYNSVTNNHEKVSSEIEENQEPVAWDIGNNGEEGKSIADQVKEVAQSAMQQSGMVYVETAGMYYDYKTGYYYNSELGVYYHPDTGCYYRYLEDKKEFVFHSYPDRSAAAASASLLAHEKRKAKKDKKVGKAEEDVDNLTRNLSQEDDQATMPKRQKKDKKTPKENKEHKKTNEPKIVTNVENLTQGKIANDTHAENKDTQEKLTDDTNAENMDSQEKIADATNAESPDTEEMIVDKDQSIEKKKENDNVVKEVDLEDGECSETASEVEESDADESDASTSTISDDDAVTKHHPPCMRIIVRETTLPKLKVGSLYLVTKDGGTIGREGDQHTILIKDHNVSRNHLDIRYDMERRLYLATDLGSKNGTLLNGRQMSESQIISVPMEVMHGSVIQLGETKLLCHIHPGNDTCGHCEPGLIMETQEKEKVAYTRTCSVKKQYELELARLKNKYAPQPLMIEEGTYNDRAKARRETVGSSHHSEKTETADVDTFIAPENKGFKLLEKMGWSKGEGLGKERQGETEPIPLVSNEGTSGLGTGAVGAPKPPPPKPRNKLGESTLRLASRSKLLKPPAKAFQNLLEDDDDE